MPSQPVQWGPPTPLHFAFPRFLPSVHPIFPLYFLVTSLRYKPSPPPTPPLLRFLLIYYGRILHANLFFFYMYINALCKLLGVEVRAKLTIDSTLYSRARPRSTGQFRTSRRPCTRQKAWHCELWPDAFTSC